jgi:hypothetical protein
VEEFAEQIVQGGGLRPEHLGRPEEVFGEDGEELVLVRVGVVADPGALVRRVGEFAGDIPDPLSHDLGRDLRRQAAIDLFLLD